MLIKPCSIHFISSASSRPVLNSELANCYSMLIRWTKHLRSIRNIREDVYERPLSDALPNLKRDALELESEICIMKHDINEPLNSFNYGYTLQSVLYGMYCSVDRCNADSSGLGLSNERAWGLAPLLLSLTFLRSGFNADGVAKKRNLNKMIRAFLN